MLSKYNQVIPTLDGWAVAKYGAARASKNFKTKADAVRYGRELSRKEGAILYIYNLDGTVQDRNSYTKKPQFVKG